MSLRTAGLIAGVTLAVAGVRAAESDAFPAFDSNYLKLSAFGNEYTGNGAAFQAYTQQVKSGAGGIEDFNYTYDLDKNLNLEINGKVLPNQANYLTSFKLTQNEFGTLEVGYKRFRTFYDDIGGFFPQNNIWLPIYRQPLYVDRGKFFINATVALPNAPVFEFKYSNDTRTGTKDTTIWGSSDLTGIPVSSVSSRNFFPAARTILPSYIQLGERQENWEASMRKTVGNTNVLLTVGGDRISNLDSRVIDRYIGELKPYPAIPSNPPTTVPNNFVNNPNTGQDIQGFNENGYTVGGRIDTAINDKITVYANLNYRHATEGINASRLIYGPMLTASGLVSAIGTFTSGGRPPYSYTSSGNLKEDVFVGNVGVQLKPVPDLYVDLALRGESYRDSGTNNATYVNTLIVPTTGAGTQQLVVTPQALSNNEKPWTPAVDVRYSGIKNIALYGSWDYRITSQDEVTTYNSISPSGSTIVLAPGGGSDHIREHYQNVTVGANWTPVSLFNLRAEVFTKNHENHFTGFGSDLGSFYNLDYDIRGAKLTAIVKPIPTLSFTTRYIVQKGKSQVADDATGVNSTSGDSRRYTLGESVDWNPTKAFYMQANANVVYDTIITAYPETSGLAQTVVHNADNNYWDGNVVAGFVVTKEMDAELQGAYYKANNYNPDLGWFTQPYGAGVRDYTLTAGIKYKYDAKTVISAKVGYVESKNDTTGGYTNFKGPIGYVSVERAF